MKLNRMREEMINSFIDCLKKDTIPWHMAWSMDRPVNAVTNTRYRGINKMWLSFIQKMEGWEDPRWCTFKQAQTQGWKIKPGSKGTRVEFWSLYDTEEKRKLTQREAKQLSDELTLEDFKNRVKPISNVYTVFNGEQIDGIPKYEEKTYELNTEELLQKRDTLLKNMNVDFSEGGDKAFYNPSRDRITLPEMNRFETEYDYMATLLHEAGHATGHISRLNRDMTGVFGSPEYAKEELRAEIASAFTAQELGLDYEQNEHMENHEAYVQNWIDVLENEPNELFAAIKDAEKISDYLIEKGEFGLEETEMSKDASFMKHMDTYVALHREYINYSFFMERDASNFEKEGRIHNLTESIEKDNEIKDMLQKNEIKYKTYNHENVNEIVNDAIDFYEKINEGKSNEKEVVRDAENIQLTGAEAARFRMAMKGQERALDMFMNDESIPEHIKSDSMAIGKEAEKYFGEGLSIGEVIMNHTQDIDNSCNIFNPAYTKNLLSGLYAKTNDEYRNLKELPNLWNERELVEISEGLAEQLINEQIPIASGMFALDQVDNPRNFQGYKGSKFFVNENVLINACENGKVNLVKCEQVETPGFETGKYYTVSEYDFISREIDREYTQGNKYLWDRYKTQENIDNIKNPEEQKYIEPKTNKFKLILKGKEHSDGITLGEGKGGIVKQMSGKAFSDEVASAFKKDEQFRIFTDKVKDVYEFENSKGIPKEFRTTTDNMEVINKDMLLTQHELISNMKQPEMKAPEQNVMDFFKNTGTKTNTKARGMNRRMEIEL